uniref:Uncharacterized protein n=1 Tax=Anguilla anguilla TaxID=7936 RepID=A0A0E9VYM5_ANGAN
MQPSAYTVHSPHQREYIIQDSHAVQLETK